ERIIDVADAVRHDDGADGPRADASRAAPESSFRAARLSEKRSNRGARSSTDVSLGHRSRRRIDARLVSEVGVVESVRVGELEVVDVRPHDRGHGTAAFRGSQLVFQEEAANPPNRVETVDVSPGEEERDRKSVV